MEDLTLIMPFKNDSNDFALGFECGQVFEMLNHRTPIRGKYIHAENRQQIENTCILFHAKYTISDIYDGWCVLDAEIDFSKAN